MTFAPTIDALACQAIGAQETVSLPGEVVSVTELFDIFQPSFLAMSADPAAAESVAGSSALFSLQSLISLLTLMSLEIILGIDNVIFIAILAGKLPREQQAKARRLGIAMAVISRIALLLGITWVMRLTQPLFSLFDFAFSGKQLILLGGGLFLIAKATYEIHDKLEGVEEHGAPGAAATALAGVVLQIMLIDIVFSLDSVITAVGMTPHIPLMIIAVIAAAVVMLVFSGPISDFVHKHPTFKMLALAFLILIGVMLVAEGFGQHIDKGYIYFAMAFSLIVEVLNLRMRRKAAPVPLRHSELPE
jgi:predicted tellurium resistance membrane protein TerC